MLGEARSLGTPLYFLAVLESIPKAIASPLSESTVVPYATSQGWCHDQGWYDAWGPFPYPVGGYCDCGPGSAADAGSCYAKGDAWGPFAAAALQASDLRCQIYQLAVAAPGDCPAGCTSYSGTVEASQYAGDGDAGVECMVPNTAAPTTRLLICGFI